MDPTYDAVQNTGRWISFSALVLLFTWESFRPFFGFFRKRLKDRGQHALRNMVLALLNGLLVAFGFVWLWMWAADLAAANDFGLLHQLDLPTWARAAAALLLFDFSTYWWHRMNHVIPFLWRFHRVHHSDSHMDVTTGLRFHLGEIFLSSVLRIALLLLFGAELWHIALYEALLLPYVQFQHANIGLPDRLDRALRLVLVSPNMHKVHHSRLQPETDSNYTSLLSIWDRLFGSFRMRKDPASIEFGLDAFDGEEHQALPGLLITPLRGDRN